jgi:hypothetical protein
MASDKGVNLSDVEISRKYRIEFKHYSKKNSKNNREPITATVTNSAVNFNNAKNDIFLHLRTFQVRGNCYICHPNTPTKSAF